MYNKYAGKYLGDEMSRAVRTAKDAAVTAEESTVESAHTLYNQAYDAAAEMGDSVGSAIRRVSSLSFFLYGSSLCAIFQIMVSGW